MKTMVTKDAFFRIWFSNSGHQNLGIALFLVSSFFNGSINSITFYGKRKSHLSIYFFIFLLTICQCERLFELKEKNTSYNQCFLTVINELSSNLNNEFRSSRVKDKNFKS